MGFLFLFSRAKDVEISTPARGKRSFTNQRKIIIGVEISTN